MGATPVAVGGGGGKVSGAANLIYATPDGTSGDATLRALVSADIPGGTNASTFEIDADQTSRWRLSRSSAYDFDVEHYNGSSWVVTHRTSDYGSDIILHFFLGTGSFSYNAGTTDDAQNVLTLTANRAGGAPLAGFGTSFTLQAESSTTEYASLARIASVWTNPTHASRASKLSLYVMQAGAEVEGAYVNGAGLNSSRINFTSHANNYIVGNGANLEIWAQSSVLFQGNGGSAIFGAANGQNSITIYNGGIFNRTSSPLYRCISNTYSGSGWQLYMPSSSNKFYIDAGDNYWQSNIRTIIAIDPAGYLGIGTTTPATKIHAALSSTATNTVENVVTIEKLLSSGTAAAGLGAAINFALHSTTAVGQNAARLASSWNVATHASRAADLIGYVSDANGEREGWRIRATGSAASIGFLGATPAIQQTGGAQTATGTWTATEQDMLQKAYDALRTFGLLS